ncbi:MAG: hypothetical protein A2665_02095 [Candidatus Zambryskibacteria bacterium RIFCSPHIGHO2_01_FULL_46_30]|uniref:GIY-YIG domain-containing protein n=1 Tax=Candidatus Zambryskibacteria bacterium RIFCSPHIGHO2_01_FULL_46_30 TaxID=1802739 RepID=A0A1G2T5M8_9BACT|nr:MAG: hypothetical protein A2665_02095 [Candidatus Zambryskibacteria bacterium RIFCSPHIGHO2_01_FULL_46_30]OHB06285.1 MAG: hypothetical protein A3B22_00140 [Candidatus Zambryskibacteria bacterium RIFCSPLOWO2_01_FULL_47_33]
MQIVYVLKSEQDRNLYIGCTSNLKKRLDMHNKGKVLSTRSRRPFKLVYSESFSDKYKAFLTERLYKTTKGKRVLLEKIKSS